MGTAHVSRASAEEVRELPAFAPSLASLVLTPLTCASRCAAHQVRQVIRAVRPDTVLVELCAARARRLMAPDASWPSSLAEALAALGGAGTLGEKVLGLGLKGFYAAWRHAGLEPGLEFKVLCRGTSLLHPQQLSLLRHHSLGCVTLIAPPCRLRWRRRRRCAAAWCTATAPPQRRCAASPQL